ncbi:MAG TPA: molybdopterin oxidoreductase family protein [Gemmatimonadaceae bacterium]|nr:molybdopterin oxidoreductase family protein [Gemmatimonadaceae bacterium]
MTPPPPSATATPRPRRDTSDPAASPTTTVRGACPHDCPDTCATLVSVDAAGRAVRIAGDPDHPFTQGFLCAKVNRYLERTYHRDRLTTPLRRAGPKGSGRFEPVSWDEALDEVATRLAEIAAGPHGPQAILPYSYAGTMGLVQGSSMDRRFFHALGASRLARTICAEAGAVGMRMTVGANVGADAEGIPESDLVLLWGTNTLTSNPHLWPHVLEARKRGAKVIAIDPIRTRTAEQCDEWLAIRPGTDAALALGMMHVLFAEGLADEDYLARYTIGAEGLRERVKEYPPERVAEITGLSAARVAELGREYGRAKACFVRINYGLQRHYGGGMAVRTIACLPAVSGHWRRPGGGVQLSTSANFKFNNDALQRPDLGPPARTINMIRLGDALTRADAGVGGPPVQALVVYNSNPAAVAPELGTVRRGLARDDLFTVVLEHFQTDTADWADIVLPATTQLEHWDVHYAYGHLYATLNRPAIAPLGEAKPNSEIFRLLAARVAARMGPGSPLHGDAFRDDDQTLIRQALDTSHERMAGVTFERLMADGWARLNVPRPYVPFAEGNFPSPSGKCELYSARLEAMGMDPLPTYHAPREMAETAPALAAKYPLVLISSPRHQFLNTTFVNVDSLRRNAEPECVLHPRDAARRGLSDGERVVVHNDRGHFAALLRLSDGIREGVTWAPSIWWRKLSPDGHAVNDTTSQGETDLGGGPVFYDNLVEVSQAD